MVYNGIQCNTNQYQKPLLINTQNNMDYPLKYAEWKKPDIKAETT